MNMILDAVIVGFVVSGAVGFLVWRVLPKRSKAQKAECCGSCPAAKATAER